MYSLMHTPSPVKPLLLTSRIVSAVRFPSSLGIGPVPTTSAFDKVRGLFHDKSRLTGGTVGRRWYTLYRATPVQRRFTYASRETAISTVCSVLGPICSVYQSTYRSQDVHRAQYYRGVSRETNYIFIAVSTFSPTAVATKRLQPLKGSPARFPCLCIYVLTPKRAFKIASSLGDTRTSSTQLSAGLERHHFVASGELQFELWQSSISCVKDTLNQHRCHTLVHDIMGFDPYL